jgi:hypothetical protein
LSLLTFTKIKNIFIPFYISKAFKLPAVRVATNVTLTLRIFNTYVLRDFDQDLLLLPQNYTDPKDILDFISNSTTNNTNSSNFSSIYSNELVVRTKSFVESTKKDITLNETKVTEEIILKNIFEDFNFTCNEAKDCNKNGKCLRMPVSPKLLCNCYSGFTGHTCAWTEQKFMISRSLVNVLIESLNSPDESYKPEEVLEVVNSVSQLTDCFTESTLKASIYLISNLSDILEEDESKKKYLKTIDNLFDIFEILKPKLNQENKEFLSYGLENILIRAIESLSKDLDKSSSFKKDLPFLNFYGQIRALDFLAESSEKTLTLHMNPFDKNISFSFNQHLSQFIKNESLNLYSEVLIRPPYNFPDYDWNPQKRFFSSVVSISLKFKDAFLHLQFDKASRMNISIPKALRVSSAPKEKNPAEVFLCVYYDKSKKTWSTEGLKFINETDDAILCETSHLSDFAIQLTNNNSLIDEVLPCLRRYVNGCGNFEFGRSLIMIFVVFGLLNLLIFIAHLAGQYSKKKISNEDLNMKVKSEKDKQGDMKNSTFVQDVDESKVNFTK